MALTVRAKKLIDRAAELNTSLAEKLKSSGLSFLPWVSPIGSRSPEETEAWHPSYGKNFLSRIGKYIFCIARSLAKGTWYFLTYKGFGYIYINEANDILLVIPDEITDHSPGGKTSYLSEDERFGIDKIVFSRSKRMDRGFTSLSYFKKIKIFTAIASAITKDVLEKIRKRKADVYYTDVLIIFLEWFLSQSWYLHIDLYLFVKGLVSSGAPYKALAAVHEMHFYSKLIWQVAKEESLLAVTGQHAMVIPEKLWYFPHRREIDAGVAVPDVFFVYSETTKEMLKKNYPDSTEFPLCYSPRFKQWKDIAKIPQPPKDMKGREYVLFVGGLTPYDTAILVEAIDNLLKIGQETANIKIKMRPHPHARVRMRDKIWISKASRLRSIELSNGSLADDLEKSLVVVGAYTMVLRQAALLGLPVLSVQSDKYMHPSVLPEGEKWNVQIGDFCWDRLTRQIDAIPDEAMKENLMKDLGAGNAEFSTKLIYEKCDIREKRS
ncbi:MAG: hypothetical protein JW994_06515 [Candidatus Omnitrophica bacterium]|nr:hypothetical protein [Candidatus Omnitrophota bacterium]